MRVILFGWLAALALWIGWPLGSMALLLIHRLTGGRWGDALRPALRAATATLPLLLPALLPVLLFPGVLYPWARPGEAAHLTNGFYLNLPFWYGRWAVYAVLWLGLAALTLLTPPTETRVAAAGLPLLALSFTFAAADLTQSLDPLFNSSVYGFMQGSAAVLFALSLAVLAAARRAEDAAILDLARLLLTLVMLWAYLDFMQFVIVWESNLSYDAGWYVRRTQGGWGAVYAALAIFHFALPFFLLIVPSIQRSRRAVAGIAVLLAAAAALRAWWIVLPAMQSGFGIASVGCLLLFAAAGWAATRFAARHMVGRHV